MAAFTGKLTVGKSQLLAHPVTHSGFRLQHDDLTSRTYSHLPLQDNDIVFNKGFPIRVNHGYRSAGYSASDEILKGLANQGLLDVSQQANGFSSVDVLEVTDKGQAVEFWDRKDGACVGHRAVAEIKEWTEPGNGNQKVVRVSYTWKLADVPSWVDKKVFSSVKGMNEPEESMINLVKTSNGWKAI
ncbi:DNA-directed RNA polymerase subunit beta [Klebsiella pneumoniae]|uniref:DNA-directed RNA polymerase subunit beta n=1 Tax=Klebsiella pneumoniae TaxID=573 RepID=UPI003B3AA1D8